MQLLGIKEYLTIPFNHSTGKTVPNGPAASVIERIDTTRTHQRGTQVPPTADVSFFMQKENPATVTLRDFL